MSTFGVIALVVLFCIMQMLFIKKVNRRWIKYIPTEIGCIGVVIGLVIYYISDIAFNLNMYSQSVLSENQYFALTIWIMITPCLVGCILGIILAKFLGKKQILYFIPFILSVIIYIGATFMGLGLISVKEIIWLVLFLTSGFLLSMGKFWGSIFGLIPALTFVYMSTQEAGQVINIELPLGIGIAIYYIVCSFIVYKKCY